MPRPECFIPSCNQRASSSSNRTFHRLPSSTNLLRRLLLLLFEDSDPSEFPVVKNDSVMCSEHFGLLMSDTDLVHVLVNSMITKKPSQEAAAFAPKCAAFGCCINLYSDVPLFIFPSVSSRLTLWRMVAGWPKMSDCNYLCARHFKRSSFLDEDRRQLKRGEYPLYPTRPFNTKFQNYCPLKKPAPAPPPVNNLLDQSEGEGAAKPKKAPKKWRCAAKGCDVSYLSHPEMRKINFPCDPDRLNLWHEVVGSVPNVKYNISLCTRHFALSQFYDEETRRNFVKLANPVYPTRRLNVNTNDYCPPELDVTVHMEQAEEPTTVDRVAAEESVITVVKGSSTAEIFIDIKRCSAAGCPVNSQTHPNVKLHDFPETNMRKMLVWLKMAGCPTEKPRRLCERHFDGNSRDLMPKYPFGDLDPETFTYKPVFNPIDPKCCVPGCKVSPEDDDLVFHRFPLEKTTFDAWIRRIGCKKLALYDQRDVFRGFRVCSRHFARSCYFEKPSADAHSGSETVLEPTAVPTRRLGNGDDARSAVRLEFCSVGDAAGDSASDNGDPEIIVETALTGKRKSKDERPLNSKRFRGEVVDQIKRQLQRSQDVSSDEEVDSTDPLDLSDAIAVEGGRSGFAEESFFCSEITGSRESEEDIYDTSGVEEPDGARLSACSSELSWSVIDAAVRLCKIDSGKTESMKHLSGNRKIALDAFANVLGHSLTEIVSTFGLRFLTNCFSQILGIPMRVADDDSVVSDLDAEELEELNDEPVKFSVIMLTFSRKLYSAVALVASLPSPYRVRNWLIGGSGVPGMSLKGFSLLKEKYEIIGVRSFLVSLAVVEIPLKKEAIWSGKEVCGLVDLGHGRIADVDTEATAALVFYANSPSHDFLTPLGYCLVNGLPPSVRANMICLYLLQIHSTGVRCNSVVCENSTVTHQTYRELGVVSEKGLPAGYFEHPGRKSEPVFCFVDVDDAFRSVSNVLAEKSVFLSNDAKDVRWSDVETVHGLPQWDLWEFSESITRFQYLRSLQLKLKKDVGVFKKNSSLVLRALKKRSESKSGTGTCEFLTKMDTVDYLFRGCNRFCKESPALHRENVMMSLGRIKNALTYISSLKDRRGCNLLGSSGNFSGLALDLVSLDGYLRKLLVTEKRGPKDRAMTIRTRSLTLRDIRSAIGSVGVVTAKEFRAKFKSLLKNDRKPLKSEKPPDPLNPLHVGLNVTESYKCEPLRSSCEHIEDYLARNVVCRWLDETPCPDCCFLVSMETPGVGPSLSSDVRKLLRTAERCLRTAEEVPLEGENFSRFVCSVLLETADFSGFLKAGHLFDSVEFGRTCHFTVMVNSLLRIFLRYRIGFMSTTTKIVVKADSRQTIFQRSSVLF